MAARDRCATRCLSLRHQVLAHRRFKAPAPIEAVRHDTLHRGAGGEDKVPMRRYPFERGSPSGICQGSVDRRSSEEYPQRRGTGSASESLWSCRITMRCSGPWKGMRGAPRARLNILRPRRAVRVGGRPLIAIVMRREHRPGMLPRNIPRAFSRREARRGTHDGIGSTSQWAPRTALRQ